MMEPVLIVEPDGTLVLGELRVVVPTAISEAIRNLMQNCQCPEDWSDGTAYCQNCGKRRENLTCTSNCS